MLPPSRSATREPLAATQTADIRALLGAGDEDRVAVAHFLVGALFLVLAGVFQLIALFSLRFAGLSPISFGRAESMANITVMLGFLVLTLAGGIYYVLPRLTGTRLWRKELAYLGLLGVSGLVVLDLLAVPAPAGSAGGADAARESLMEWPVVRAAGGRGRPDRALERGLAERGPRAGSAGPGAVSYTRPG